MVKGSPLQSRYRPTTGYADCSSPTSSLDACGLQEGMSPPRVRQHTSDHLSTTHGLDLQMLNKRLSLLFIELSRLSLSDLRPWIL